MTNVFTCRCALFLVIFLVLIPQKSFSEDLRVFLHVEPNEPVGDNTDEKTIKFYLSAMQKNVSVVTHFKNCVHFSNENGNVLYVRYILGASNGIKFDGKQLKLVSPDEGKMITNINSDSVCEITSKIPLVINFSSLPKLERIVFMYSVYEDENASNYNHWCGRLTASFAVSRTTDGIATIGGASTGIVLGARIDNDEASPSKDQDRN